MAYEVPPLPYDYSALEPYIDTQTMQLHHDKHHAAYVTNLNAALQNNSEFAALPIDELVRRLNEVPENIRTAVRNNGGGHANHSMFWQIMTPNGGGEPGVIKPWGQYPRTRCGAAAKSPFVQVCVVRALTRPHNTHLYYNLGSPQATHLFCFLRVDGYFFERS